MAKTNPNPPHVPVYTDRMHIEWEAWQAVVALLRETKAVTEADLTSRLSENSTPGQKLCRALRYWGESLAALRIEQVERARRKPYDETLAFNAKLNEEHREGK